MQKIKETAMDCIISMTSWRRRINDIGPVIFSFLELEPVCDFRVVLVLSSDEFPGKERDIPESLVRLQAHPRFEILWCKENSRAFKKYFPTRRKYPSVPIITVDDDEPARPNFLRDIWNLHLKDRKRVVYGYNGVPCRLPGIDCVRYGFGMFPPGSLYPLDEKFGMEFFRDMDDEYMRFLHVLAGSRHFQLNALSVLHCQAIDQDSAMQRIMRGQWTDIPGMWDRVWRVFPELHRLWKRNVGKPNG